MATPSSNLSVEEFTTPNPITASKTDNLEDLLDIMNENCIRHLPILDGSKVRASLVRDLQIALSLSSGLIAEDIMVEDPFTVSVGDSIDKVALAMSRQKIGSSIVEGVDGELYGIFTSTDALNALIECSRGTTL